MRAKTVTLHHESRLSSRLGRVFDRNVNIITKALITIRYFCELRMPLNSSPPQEKTLCDHCLTCLAATLLHCKLKPSRSVARITTFVTNFFTWWWLLVAIAVYKKRKEAITTVRRESGTKLTDITVSQSKLEVITLQHVVKAFASHEWLQFYSAWMKGGARL